MISRTLGVGVAGHVTFDVAAEDVRERTPGKKFNYARDAFLLSPVSLPGSRRSPDKRSAVLSS